MEYDGRIWRILQYEDLEQTAVRVPVYYVRESQLKMSKLLNFLMNIRRFHYTPMNHKAGKKPGGNKSSAGEFTLNDHSLVHECGP